MNFIESKLIKKDGKFFVEFGSEDTKTTRGKKYQIPLPENKNVKGVLEEYVDKELIMGIRPEDVHDEPRLLEEFSDCKVQAEVEVTELMGAETFLFVNVEGHSFTARVEPTTTARPGDTIEIALENTKIHLFDKGDRTHHLQLSITTRESPGGPMVAGGFLMFTGFSTNRQPPHTSWRYTESILNKEDLSWAFSASRSYTRGYSPCACWPSPAYALLDVFVIPHPLSAVSPDASQKETGETAASPSGIGRNIRGEPYSRCGDNRGLLYRRGGIHHHADPAGGKHHRVSGGYPAAKRRQPEDRAGP